MFRLVTAIITNDLFDDAFHDVIADDAFCLCVDVTIVFDRFSDPEIVLFALWAFFGLEHGSEPGKKALHYSAKNTGVAVMTYTVAFRSHGEQKALICQLVTLAMVSAIMRLR